MDQLTEPTSHPPAEAEAPYVNWNRVYLAVAVTAVATILGLWTFSIIYTP